MIWTLYVQDRHQFEPLLVHKYGTSCAPHTYPVVVRTDRAVVACITFTGGGGGNGAGAGAAG